MSLEIISKKFHEIEKESNIQVIDTIPDISDLIIPFSAIFENNNPPDVYTGNEVIPFNEKISEFKQILIQEFTNSIQEFNEVIKKAKF